MFTIESRLVNTAESQTIAYNARWEDKAYRCHICLIKEEGGYSAVVLNLPGAGSCGDTQEEAIENVKEAVLGVIESYLAAGEEIPWKDTPPESIPEGATQKWIIVNA